MPTFIFYNLQEIFRFGIYKILRKTEHGLQEVSDSVRVAENKHILAYVSGLGFGVMSGAFALVNILADAVRNREIETFPLSTPLKLIIKLILYAFSNMFTGWSGDGWSYWWH